jgi:hypothetical protein
MAAACAIDAESTCGIDDHHVMKFRIRKVKRLLGNCYWISDAITWFRCEDGDPCLISNHLQLIDCVRALEIARNE